MKKGFVMVLVVLALSVAAMAAPKVKKQDFELLRVSEIAGTQLQPGDYQVSVDGGTATVYRNGKSVATFAVRSEQGPVKYQVNAVVYQEDRRSVTEIRLAGTATKLHVEGSAAGIAGMAGGKN